MILWKKKDWPPRSNNNGIGFGKVELQSRMANKEIAPSIEYSNSIPLFENKKNENSLNLTLDGNLPLNNKLSKYVGAGVNYNIKMGKDFESNINYIGGLRDKNFGSNLYGKINWDMTKSFNEKNREIGKLGIYTGMGINNPDQISIRSNPLETRVPVDIHAGINGKLNLINNLSLNGDFGIGSEMLGEPILPYGKIGLSYNIPSVKDINHNNKLKLKYKKTNNGSYINTRFL